MLQSIDRLSNARGFTLIELVVVIVLMGIVGMMVFSRFTNPNSFNELAAQDTLLTSIRVAQQNALGRSNVTFEINSASGEWQFVAKTGATVITSTSVSSANVKLETGTAAELVVPTNSCSSGTRFDTPVSSFVLAFDSQGNIDSFSNTTVGLETKSPTFNGVRICVNDTVESSVCVSPAGYAYSGNCDD